MVITQTVFSGFESILAPVEAKKNDAAGIVACNKKNLAMQMQSQSDGTSKSNNHAPLPTRHTPNLRCFALGSAGSGSASVLRAKDPKVRHAWVCMMVVGLVLQGITGG